MLKIQHIKAHLPTKNCQLTFLLRKKSKTPSPVNPTLNPSLTTPAQIQLTEDYVDIDVNCVIKVDEFATLRSGVQLCAIAVTQNQKICVGWVQVDLEEERDGQVGVLKGVPGQDGYVTYSYINQTLHPKIQSTKSLQIPSMAQKRQEKNSCAVNSSSPAGNQKSSQNSRGFIKYKNSSSSSSYDNNSETQQNLQSKSGSESPFRKNKSPQHVDTTSDEYHGLLDQVYHQILVEQLWNQRVWNRIQENQIFGLRYRMRVEALLGTIPDL